MFAAQEHPQGSQRDHSDQSAAAPQAHTGEGSSGEVSGRVPRPHSPEAPLESPVSPMNPSGSAPSP